MAVFSQSGPSVAAGVGTDIEFDSAVYRQLFQVIVQFPQGMLVFCIFFPEVNLNELRTICLTSFTVKNNRIEGVC